MGERFNEGRYTALYKLGQGHYATVWMVLDGHTGQELAMKVSGRPWWGGCVRCEVSKARAASPVRHVVVLSPRKCKAQLGTKRRLHARVRCIRNVETGAFSNFCSC